jgi:hypothetical protein
MVKVAVVIESTSLNLPSIKPYPVLILSSYNVCPDRIN